MVDVGCLGCSSQEGFRGVAGSGVVESVAMFLAHVCLFWALYKEKEGLCAAHPWVDGQ